MSICICPSEAEENSKQHDGFAEGCSCSNYFHSSSFGSAAPSTHLVLKRKTYPHWEKGLLKDEVVVQLHGRDEEKVCEESESESNGTEAMTVSRLRAAAPAALATPTAEEPNNDRAHAQLYALSPDDPSPFVSSSLPHLPLATHFPPLDSRTRFLAPKPESKQQIPTFSFSRLQMMAAASASRQSALCFLAGLHNQVQGSPQSPSLWRPAFETDADIKFDSSNFSEPDGDVDEEDSFFASIKATESSRDGSIVDGWPIMQDTQLAGLRSTELAFDDSFDACLSPTVSDSSDIRQSQRDNTCSPQTDSEADSGSGSGSQCTCGHRKHFVRALREVDHDAEASDEDDAFWSRSKRGSRIEATDENTSDYNTRAVLDDMMSTVEGCAGSESSTRANASAVSLLAPVDSRTSSDLYLSPNFPDSDYGDDYFTAPVSAVRNGQKDNSTDEHHDGHRVYFPTQPAQAPSGSGLRSFFIAARRRVSSIGGAAAGRKPTRNMRRASLSAVMKPETKKRVLKDTLPAVSDADKVRLRKGRGRSNTLRPLMLSSSTCNTESPLVAREPYNHERQPEVPTSPRKTRRAGRNFSFIRRFSLQFGHPSNGSEESAASSLADTPPSSPQPALPSSSDIRSPPLPAEEEKRMRVPSGAFLFRNFTLASPRDPRANKQRSAPGRE